MNEKIFKPTLATEVIDYLWESILISHPSLLESLKKSSLLSRILSKFNIFASFHRGIGVSFNINSILSNKKIINVTAKILDNFLDKYFEYLTSLTKVFYMKIILEIKLHKVTLIQSDSINLMQYQEIKTDYFETMRIYEKLKNKLLTEAVEIFHGKRPMNFLPKKSIDISQVDFFDTVDASPEIIHLPIELSTNLTMDDISPSIVLNKEFLHSGNNNEDLQNKEFYYKILSELKLILQFTEIELNNFEHCFNCYNKSYKESQWKRLTLLEKLLQSKLQLSIHKINMYSRKTKLYIPMLTKYFINLVNKGGQI